MKTEKKGNTAFTSKYDCDNTLCKHFANTLQTLCIHFEKCVYKQV